MNFASLFDVFHKPRQESFERVSDNYRKKYGFKPDTIMNTSSESLAGQFEKAHPVMHSLCIPVEMRYGQPAKIEAKPLELASVNEVRKTENGYIFKGHSILYNKAFHYQADEAQDVRLGPDGTAIDSVGKIVEKYAIFHGDGYAQLRKELHFLLYLARQDGLFSAAEKDAVAKRVIHHNVKEEHQPLAEKYFLNSFITPEAFKHSLKSLDTMNKHEVTSIVRSAEDLIHADGKVTKEEDAAFKQIYATLGTA